jgi:hypothetical protein
MDIHDICRRCSKFSGWNLEVKLENGSLVFDDPLHGGPSRLILRLHPYGGLRETYGRMWHWGITQEEKAVMEAALKSE